MKYRSQVSLTTPFRAFPRMQILLACCSNRQAEDIRLSSCGRSAISSAVMARVKAHTKPKVRGPTVLRTSFSVGKSRWLSWSDGITKYCAALIAGNNSAQDTQQRQGRALASWKVTCQKTTTSTAST